MQLKCKEKRIYAVCGESAVTDQMCQKWFAALCAADSRWPTLRAGADQLTLIATEWRR